MTLVARLARLPFFASATADPQTEEDLRATSKRLNQHSSSRILVCHVEAAHGLFYITKAGLIEQNKEAMNAY
jgi:hypothetical protein